MDTEYRPYRRELVCAAPDDVWWVRQYIWSDGPNERIVAHWADSGINTKGQFGQEELPLWIQMA